MAKMTFQMQVAASGMFADDKVYAAAFYIGSSEPFAQIAWKSCKVGSSSLVDETYVAKGRYHPGYAGSIGWVNGGATEIEFRPTDTHAKKFGCSEILRVPYDGNLDESMRQLFTLMLEKYKPQQ